MCDALLWSQLNWFLGDLLNKNKDEIQLNLQNLEDLINRY